MPFVAAGAVRISREQGWGAQDTADASSEARSLVMRAQAGEISAFEQLMVCHQRQVLCTAARILGRQEDAKDAAQEVFFRLYRYLPRIKPESLRAWLYRVTVNICHDMARRSERLPMALLEDNATVEEALLYSHLTGRGKHRPGKTADDLARRLEVAPVQRESSLGAAGHRRAEHR